MSIPIPPNEANRIEALRQYHLLDTAPEPLYEDVVKVASALFGTPIAAISLVDMDRQWFKAITGLPVRETPRDVAFCAHTILAPETLLVQDATKDERFAQNPLVTGAPDIRFYLGAPLTTQDGHALGSLCVIDNRPRQIQPGEEAALEALRNLLMQVIESRRLNDRLAAALENLRTLSGLLPICAHCKSIRNDKGYWNNVEEYMAAHSSAQFSHSICPKCLGEHFPDFAKRA